VKVELVVPESKQVDARLAHVHRMTEELAFSLRLVALGLLLVAAAIYFGGEEEPRG
jgi:hypothetical protein